MNTKRLAQNLSVLVEILSVRPLLTRKDLAIRYERTVKTVDRWRRDGVLPSPKYLPGSTIPLWRACDLMSFEDSPKRPLSRKK